MITLLVILAVIIGLVLVGAVLVFAGGAAFLLTFGDVIIAVLIIVAIIRHFWKKKHKE